MLFDYADYLYQDVRLINSFVKEEDVRFMIIYEENSVVIISLYHLPLDYEATIFKPSFRTSTPVHTTVTRVLTVIKLTFNKVVSPAITKVIGLRVKFAVRPKSKLRI